MIKKLKYLYFSGPAVVMLFMVFLPFFANFFVCNTELLDNRPLYKKPTAFSSNFSKEYEKYYNDTFAFRKKMVKRYLKWQGRLKLSGNKAVYGLGDWVFYDSAKILNNDSMSDYKGETRFSEEQLTSVKTGLEKADMLAKKYGAKYLVVIAPNKSNIYAEYMPLNLQKARVSDISRADVAVQYVEKNSNIDIVNLKKTLLNAKNVSDFPIYYKKDTHWNQIGAYFGYNEIIKALGLKVKAFDNEMVSKNGLAPQDMDASFKDVQYKLGYLPEAKLEKIREETEPVRILVYKSSTPIFNKKIFLIRDSFAEAMIEYFARAFKEVVFVSRSSKALKEMDKLMEQYKPDFVVDEIVERNIIDYIDYEKSF